MNTETEISAISPLEEAVEALFQKIQHMALNTADTQKLKEIHQNYEQRRRDIQEFISEHDHEINPLGFTDKEIKELKRRALRLNRRLDMIGLLLDMELVVRLPQIALGVLASYLKQPHTMATATQSVDKAFNYIEHPELRKTLLTEKNKTPAYAVTEIHKTVDLLNQYFRLPLKNQHYKNFLKFLIEKGARWIPVGREIFKAVLQPKQLINTAKNNTSPSYSSHQFIEIKRKINAFDLEIVPLERKPERLHEIQGLKSKLIHMGDHFGKETIILKQKLEKLSHRLMPLPLNSQNDLIGDDPCMS